LDSSEGDNPIFPRLAESIAKSIAPKKVYVPESAAKNAPHCMVLIQTALSGGYLSRLLSQAISDFGVKRIALEVDRINMDFKLPAISGTGVEISVEETEALLKNRPLHFSDALCTGYFPYSDGNDVHMVLTDDAETVNAKLAVAREFGINTAFIYFPHTEDIISQIRPL